jgi:hypothetical protein
MVNIEGKKFLLLAEYFSVDQWLQRRCFIKKGKKSRETIPLKIIWSFNLAKPKKGQ